MTITREEVTAFHEAGHCMVAWRLGVRPKCVTIEPRYEERGLVNGEWRMYATLGDLDKMTAAQIILGGAAAVRTRLDWEPGSQTPGDQGDDEQIRKLLTTPTRPPYGVAMDKIIADLEVLAMAAVRDPKTWKDIEAVAALLLQKKTVDQFAIAKVIEPDERGTVTTEQPSIAYIKAWDVVNSAPSQLSDGDINCIAGNCTETRNALRELRTKAIAHNTERYSPAEQDALHARVEERWGDLLRNSGGDNTPTPLLFTLLLHEAGYHFAEEMNSKNVWRNERLDKLEAENRDLKARLDALEGRPPEVKMNMPYRNVWAAGSTYAKGDMVSLNGSVWVALEDGVRSNPKVDHDRWRLAVMRGHDAKVDPEQLRKIIREEVEKALAVSA